MPDFRLSPADSIPAALQDTYRPFQSVGKQRPGTGDIQPDESFSAGAVQRARIDHQFLFFLQTQGRIVRADTGRPAIDPDQVSSFERQHGVLRQSFFEKRRRYS